MTQGMHVFAQLVYSSITNHIMLLKQKKITINKVSDGGAGGILYDEPLLVFWSVCQLTAYVVSVLS
jgi:hypothetical protein